MAIQASQFYPESALTQSKMVPMWLNELSGTAIYLHRYCIRLQSGDLIKHTCLCKPRKSFNIEINYLVLCG